MIKLLIVEDQLVTLEMLSKVLEQPNSISVVGSITTTDLVVNACRRLNPDVILMDIMTKSSTNGIQVTKLVKERFPNIKVMLITGFEEIRFPKLAQEAGADAFLSKNISVTELKQSILQVMAGKKLFNSAPQEIKLGPANASLTEHQLEILRLLCQGKTRSCIAEELHISVHTVNFHINNMLIRTGCSNITALATDVAKKGYIILD